MIYPIVTYGNTILCKKAKEINKDYSNLNELIENMFETMYYNNGIGLAATQINLSIRLFVMDIGQGFKKVFINPNIIEKYGDDCSYNEGCLSFPNIFIYIKRPEKVKIEYYDENWELHLDTFVGIESRVIQHEYDHLEGILFTGENRN